MNHRSVYVGINFYRSQEVWQSGHGFMESDHLLYRSTPCFHFETCDGVIYLVLAVPYMTMHWDVNFATTQLYHDGNRSILLARAYMNIGMLYM